MEINAVKSMNLVSANEKKVNEGTNMLISFADYLKGAMDETSKLENYSSALTDDFAAGRTDNIHDVMIASEKAGVALDFIMQIRTKMLDAYNEIMRMQL